MKNYYIIIHDHKGHEVTSVKVIAQSAGRAMLEAEKYARNTYGSMVSVRFRDTWDFVHDILTLVFGFAIIILIALVIVVAL